MHVLRSALVSVRQLDACMDWRTQYWESLGLLKFGLKGNLRNIVVVEEPWMSMTTK